MKKGKKEGEQQLTGPEHEKLLLIKNFFSLSREKILKDYWHVEKSTDIASEAIIPYFFFIVIK